MGSMNPMSAPLPPPPPDPSQGGMPMPPPPGQDPSMMGAQDPTMGADPLSTSIDPNSLAGVIAQAIASARDAGHQQLDQMQDQATQAAQAHPVVQSMMQSLQPQGDPTRGVAGGAMSPGAPMPPDPSMMGQ